MYDYIGYTDFQDAITAKSELYNMAGRPPIITEQNGYGWKQTNALDIFYPNYVAIAEDGSPLIGYGFDAADEATSLLSERLRSNKLCIEGRAYPGIFTFGKTAGDSARFEIRFQRSATHILLDVSSFDSMFIMNEQELAQFGAKYNAVYQSTGPSLHQLCILPIGCDDNVAEMAVHFLWMQQSQELIADTLREACSHRRSVQDDKRSLGRLAYECLEDRLLKLVAEQQNQLLFMWDEETETCVIGQHIIGDHVVCNLNTKDGLRSLAGSLVYFENCDRPLTDFYGQPTA